MEFDSHTVDLFLKYWTNEIDYGEWVKCNECGGVIEKEEEKSFLVSLESSLTDNDLKYLPKKAIPLAKAIDSLLFWVYSISWLEGIQKQIWKNLKYPIEYLIFMLQQQYRYFPKCGEKEVLFLKDLCCKADDGWVYFDNEKCSLVFAKYNEWHDFITSLAIDKSDTSITEMERKGDKVIIGKRPCSQCGGTGKVEVREVCSECDGIPYRLNPGKGRCRKCLGSGIFWDLHHTCLYCQGINSYQAEQGKITDSLLREIWELLNFVVYGDNMDFRWVRGWRGDRLFSTIDQGHHNKTSDGILINEVKKRPSPTVKPGCTEDERK